MTNLTKSHKGQGIMEKHDRQHPEGAQHIEEIAVLFIITKRVIIKSLTSLFTPLAFNMLKSAL